MPVINLASSSKRPSKGGSPPCESGSESDSESETPRQKRPRHDNPNISPLCTECQTLDLYLDRFFDFSTEFFKRTRKGEPYQGWNGRELERPHSSVRRENGRYFVEDAFHFHNFEGRLREDATCPLCQFFRSMRVQPDEHERFKLIALPSSESWLFRLDILRESSVWDEAEDSAFMAVVPDLEWLPQGGHEPTWIERHFPSVGMIQRAKAEEPGEPDRWVLARPRELQGCADMALVREWLGICRLRHGNTCKARTSHETVERGFRLIVCEADPPKVETQPWGTAYAALSYVWGTNPEDLVEWPKTVLDAVAVTKEIGLRYLWIDRLCINQSDADEKTYLISKMATIYEGAEVTIVAAAGNGAGNGLAGVRTTPRRSQPKHTLSSGSKLLSTVRDPRHDILESSYWTRGWTYQEGILSNRRIVFTEHQVYWECRSMAAQESIMTTFFQTPLADDHGDNNDTHSRNEASGDGDGGVVGNGDMAGHEGQEFVMADFMLTGIFKSDAYSGGSASNQASLVIFDDDPYRLDYGFPPHLRGSLRAQLRGLNEHIRAYSNRRLTQETDALPAFMGITSMYGSLPGLYLLHGLPLWLQGSTKACSATQLTFALSACTWYHRRSMRAAQMFISEPCNRRSHLPSWSWAGWDGPVSWRAPPAIEHCSIMADFIEAITNGEPPNPLWAAELRLCNSVPMKSGIMPPRTMALRDCHSPDALDAERPDAIVLQDPYVLKDSVRSKVVKRGNDWYWGDSVGRVGRTVHTGESVSWDQEQYRIGKRLSFVALSVEMTEEQWTEQHLTGELMSVLLWATRWVDKEQSGHGGAHFMTLRKVRDFSPGVTCWERVGVVFLVIPNWALDKLRVDEDLSKKDNAWIPVKKLETVIVIQ
ncbi:hypothetical protein OQA88_64 [Cercophora sp. LCS_1]